MSSSEDEDEGGLNAGAGSDLVGRKFQLARHSKIIIFALAELGTYTTDDGEDADVFMVPMRLPWY